MVKYFHWHIPDLDIYYDKPLESTRCEEIKPNGSRCKRKVVIGAPYCHTHLKYKHFLVVRDSTIQNAGKGVFVLDVHREEDEIIFRKGDRVCYYEGEVLSHEQFLERYSNADKTAPYTVQLHNNKYEDGALKRGIGSLLNHKRMNQCNCKLSISRNNRAQIIATKNIYNYEELFINYGRSYRFNEEAPNLLIALWHPTYQPRVLKH
jgi:SET domain-containing protein